MINLLDYTTFTNNLSGPGVSADCPLFDADVDLDVDLIAFGAFQAAFTTP